MKEVKFESLIYDENLIEEFYHKVLEGIKNYEVNFISVAARNKYLTDEERHVIRLGHTCMLGKTVTKTNDSKKYLNKIKQLDAASNFYTDFDGNYLPRKCMVVYANINPTSAPKATYEFKKLLADYDKEALYLATENNTERFDNLLNRYKNLHNNMMTCYQTQRSKKRWIDIDCDMQGIDPEELFKALKEHYLSINPKFSMVKPIGIITHGGLHILIKTEELRDDPNKIVEAIKDIIESKELSENASYDEIIINKNEMIPVPGTYQGTAKVRMIF